MRFSELRDKEIINICDGRRLGFACDAEIEMPKGEVRALIVPGPARFFGLFGREPDYLIPMECIRRMGQDIALVEIQGNYGREKKNKKNYL